MVFIKLIITAIGIFVSRLKNTYIVRYTALGIYWERKARGLWGNAQSRMRYILKKKKYKNIKSRYLYLL